MAGTYGCSAAVGFFFVKYALLHVMGLTHGTCRIVERNISTALILEDDADWDVRIKSQLQVFAQAARAFTQPMGKDGMRNTMARTFTPAPDEHSPLEFPLAGLPQDLHPKLSPYGDDWDVLWLGHCGTEFPQRSAFDQEKKEKSTIHPSHRPPLMRVIVPNDPTVPSPDHMKAHPFALKDAMADEYPAHTRIVHASKATTCTQAYAVTQQGARKLLWQFGLQTLTSGWDFMLRDWCDGIYAGDDEGAGAGGADTNMRLVKPPVCVTVQPPLFSHHFGKGAASDITAPGGGFINKDKEMTPYIRWSVRLNMGRLVKGAGVGDLLDQYPDERHEQ